MKQPFFIAIDDVYDDPDKVREYALNCEYGPRKTIPGTGFDNGKATWDGKQSIKPYPKRGEIIKIANEVTGKKLFNSHPDSGKFRITKGSEVNTFTEVHYDNCVDYQYAGVIYLNKLQPWQSIPGTILYKDAVEGIKKATDASGIAYPVDRETLCRKDKWIPHIISNIVYNRLIIYKANYFHHPAQPFGDTDEEARLIQIFFWTEDGYRPKVL